MLFHTIDFILFFALVYALYRALPGPARPYLLLGASLFFYAHWKPAAALLLVATATLVYLCARRIPAGGERERRALLVAGVAWCLGSLAFFKYQGLLSSVVVDAADGSRGSGALALALPIGISFYTFQLIAYLADVYRATTAAAADRRSDAVSGRTALPTPQRVASYRDLLLFTAYFPQLISGPIERARRLLPRLRRARPPSARRTASGLKLAAWGFFKKLFIADNLAPLSQAALAPGAEPTMTALSLAACIFAVQLYADFSGYVDIARGLSRMLGVELSANFRLPILATGPAEFWRRWHVTLYAFFRDYVYVPLGGGRLGRSRTLFHVLFVFFLGGLWHGSGWPFALWGLYCGLTVAGDIALRPFLAGLVRFAPSTARWTGRTLTFLIFAYGLLLFHVQSPEHALELLRGPGTLPDPETALALASRILQAALFVWPLPLVELWLARPGSRRVFERRPVWLQATVFAVGALLLFWFGAFGAREFYYFQF